MFPTTPQQFYSWRAREWKQKYYSLLPSKYFYTIYVSLWEIILESVVQCCGNSFWTKVFFKLHQVSRFLWCVLLILGFMGQGNADSQCDGLSFRKRRWSFCKGGVLVYPERLASGPVCWCTRTRGRTWSWSMSTPSWEPLKPINSALWTLHLLISMWPILQMQALVFILMKR